MKTKRKAALAVRPVRPTVINKLPTGVTPKRAHVADAELRRLASEMTQTMFRFMDIAQGVIDQKLYVGMHYQTVEEYFEQRIGFSWRSLRRRLAIHEAVRTLEASQQASARRALIALGIHRAAILAPVLKAKPDDWFEWVRLAKRLDEDALQAKVSQALGAKPRGRAHEREGAAVRSTGQIVVERAIGLMPEDARGEARDVFRAGLVAHEAERSGEKIDPWILVLEWFAAAEERGWKSESEQP